MEALLSINNKQFTRISLNQFRQRYQYDVQLGNGSYGTVYKAKTSQNHIVAIKQFSKQAVRQFNMIIHEISNLKRLEHRNILKFYECYIIDDNKYVLVTEFCEGGCLTTGLLQVKFSQEHEKIAVCQQIAEGLAFAHSQNIIHRDLKLENIFVGQGNVIKIGDFGCSTRIQNNGVMITRIGSAAFMDDRVQQGQQYDVSADIYSLGLLFLSIFNGKGIYDNCKNEKEIRKMKSQIYRNYSQNIRPYLSGLPSIIQQIIQNCLDSDYQGRYTSRQIADSLKDHLTKASIYSKVISTQAQLEEDEEIEDEISLFAYSLLTKKKDLDSCMRSLQTRKQVYTLLSKNQQNFNKITNIQELKFVSGDTKAQFTLIVSFYYRYWLEQIDLIVHGYPSNLSAKYRQIDNSSIDKEALNSINDLINHEQIRAWAILVKCAQKVNSSLNLISKDLFLPDNFRDLVGAVVQKQNIEFQKYDQAQLKSGMSAFLQRRIKKEYKYNMENDELDPRLSIIQSIGQSFY